MSGNYIILLLFFMALIVAIDIGTEEESSIIKDFIKKISKKLKKNSKKHKSKQSH